MIKKNQNPKTAHNEGAWYDHIWSNIGFGIPVGEDKQCRILAAEMQIIMHVTGKYNSSFNLSDWGTGRI